MDKMTGIIYKRGKLSFFREDGTKKLFKIKGFYDVNGNIQTEFKWPNGHECEAVEIEGEAVIKFKV